MARVSDEQDQPVTCTVAQLHREPSLKRLNVSQPGLRLDGYGPSLAGHHGVPGTSIAGDRKRHFVGVAEAGQSSPEPRQEGQVCRIPDRVIARKHPKRKIQSEHGRQQCQMDERDSTGLTELDPTDLRRRDAHGYAELRLGQARGVTSVPQLVTEPPQRLIRTAPRSIEAALASRHLGTMPADAHPRINRDGDDGSPADQPLGDVAGFEHSKQFFRVDRANGVRSTCLRV